MESKLQMKMSGPSLDEHSILNYLLNRIQALVFFSFSFLFIFKALKIMPLSFRI